MKEEVKRRVAHRLVRGGGAEVVEDVETDDQKERGGDEVEMEVGTETHRGLSWRSGAGSSAPFAREPHPSSRGYSARIRATP